MSETYPSKRERWQRMREALPADLRLYVSLRNVEAVAGLSHQAQTHLIEAIQAGLKRLPRAIDQLKANADTPVSELLNPAQVATTSTQERLKGELPQEIRSELADLVQACYPDMPRLSAEALVESEAMQVAVFLVAFFMLNALSTAQRPPTVQVLSAAHDLNIGDVISPDSLEVKTVFQDDNSNLYITVDEVEGVAGGIVAQPILSGQPVFRTAILAPAAGGTRLSAALAEYPAIACSRCHWMR